MLAGVQPAAAARNDRVLRDTGNQLISPSLAWSTAKQYAGLALGTGATFTYPKLPSCT